MTKQSDPERTSNLLFLCLFLCAFVLGMVADRAILRSAQAGVVSHAQMVNNDCPRLDDGTSSCGVGISPDGSP